MFFHTIGKQCDELHQLGNILPGQFGHSVNLSACGRGNDISGIFPPRIRKTDDFIPAVGFGFREGQITLFSKFFDNCAHGLLCRVQLTRGKLYIPQLTVLIRTGLDFFSAIHSLRFLNIRPSNI